MPTQGSNRSSSHTYSRKVLKTEDDYQNYQRQVTSQQQLFYFPGGILGADSKENRVSQGKAKNKQRCNQQQHKATVSNFEVLNQT